MISSEAKSAMNVRHMDASAAKRADDLSFVRIEASVGRALGLRELWDYRELLYFFVWRDVKVPYLVTRPCCRGPISRDRSIRAL